MPSRSEYDTTLDKLSAMLRRKPLTARAIADALGCSKPVAYSRVRALKERGEAVYSIATREAKRGPESVSYGVR